jgi:hypothetical protein
MKMTFQEIKPEPLSRNESGRFGALNLIQPTISLEMPVPSQGTLRFSQFSGC